MDLFQQTLDLLVHQVAPISGGNRLGFEVDLAEAASRSRVLRARPVVTPVGHRHLILLPCGIEEGGRSVGRVYQDLLSIWHFVSYRGFGVHSVDLLPEALVLRYATVSSPPAYFAAGAVVASSPGFSLLVERHRVDHPHAEVLAGIELPGLSEAIEAARVSG